MMSKVTACGLIVAVSVLLSSCDDGGGSIQRFSSADSSKWNGDSSGTGALLHVAGELESPADKLYSRPLEIFRQSSVSNELDTTSCGTQNTAVITVYTTNGKAQTEIDVMLDGSHIGNLKTYFPNGEPSCSAQSAEGVITLRVPAGKHTLEAVSSNVTWPGHVFSVEKCECRVLPLD